MGNRASKVLRRVLPSGRYCAHEPAVAQRALLDVRALDHVVQAHQVALVQVARALPLDVFSLSSQARAKRIVLVKFRIGPFSHLGLVPLRHNLEIDAVAARAFGAPFLGILR